MNYSAGNSNLVVAARPFPLAVSAFIMSRELRFPTCCSIAIIILTLAVIQSYLERLVQLYGDRDAWARRAILNMAGCKQIRKRSNHRRVCGQYLECGTCPVE